MPGRVDVRRRAAVLAVAAGPWLLAGTACSTSADRGSDEQRLLEAVLIKGSEDANSLGFDEDSARCAAVRILEDVGAERLEEVGLDVGSSEGPDLGEPPLTRAEADAVYAAFDACLDLVDELTTAFAGDAQLPDDVARCVAERYRDSGVLRDALLSLDFDPALSERIDATVLEAIAACQPAG